MLKTGRTAAGQGTVSDYAQYFRHTEITEEQARQRGLLARVKGKTGFRSGKSASDDVYSRYLSGKLSEAKAEAIAKGAPGDERVQLAASAKADSLAPGTAWPACAQQGGDTVRIPRPEGGGKPTVADGTKKGQVCATVKA